ncbi:acyl-CoA synthetase (AMP-forming)/AMP-acid ligase II [Streptomyces olivoverticillatus]|uniref:Acyl-CoA synthetase (AMP-forming)/AMP-acid ligase II n=1 Tax=Streptomyces olivoverticillatus TaxID=66427 RepID=A0A7W7LTS2_9ACTN|nr:fatty acyl-AMP ligase [Streptomyces olivoverticillatus]MBB4895927.1 acyl-CoA synthetase (AMP-forming)/AMP-acid ligase II [Streptomyces olivoverticillatus]
MRDNLVDRLLQHARTVPEKDATVFVRMRGAEQLAERVSYAELDREARAIAGWLRTHCEVGDRVLLLYPNGLDFVRAFVGCLYAGVIAVPAPVPDNNGRRGSRTAAIATNAQVRLVLTDSGHLESVTEAVQQSGLEDLPCVATDATEFGENPDWTAPEIHDDTVAFLQYTSGSTSDPKGVIVPHRALTANLRYIAGAFGLDSETASCSWLPLYHDMGLIGMLLTPLLLGGTAVLMAPGDFLRRPHAWLRLFHDYRGTFTAAPNFAYDLCAQRVSEKQLAQLDLSTLQAAVNGAEPVIAATVDRFNKHFAPAGLRPDAVKPSYGMAEATLLVTGTPHGRDQLITRIDGAELERNAFTRQPETGDGPLMVSSGPVDRLEIRIVDPQTGVTQPDGRVGEVWLRGESLAVGYWNNEAETERAFQATTAEGETGFLRTGDLGVLDDGELYITGRSKDVLIVHGRNLYPHDIERETSGLHPALQGLQGSACSVPADQEEIVVMHELSPVESAGLDLDELARGIREQLAESLGIRLPSVVLLRPGHIRRTTSGKVQRALMRELFMTGGLKPVHEDLSPEVSRRYRAGAAA